MINSDINSNGLGNNATGIATFHKQSPIATKKVALRDVNNNSQSLLPNGKETLVLLEDRALGDGTKLSGTKRPTPTLTNNATNNQFTYARRKLESEVSKGNIPGNTLSFTDLPPRQGQQSEKNMTFPRAYANSTIPSVPNFVGKPGNGFSEARQFGEQKRSERQNRLQDYIKYCDSEPCEREHIQRLQHLSPAELSRRAVELEKRAIHLTIEEGKEMLRMKSLNIVIEKSASIKAPLQAAQKLHPRN